MIIYFCDRQLNILGQASTTLPAGNRISQDKLVEDVETGVNTFECVIHYGKSTRRELESALVVGNYILKKSDTSASSSSLSSTINILAIRIPSHRNNLQRPCVLCMSYNALF